MDGWIGVGSTYDAILQSTSARDCKSDCDREVDVQYGMATYDKDTGACWCMGDSVIKKESTWATMRAGTCSSL